MIYILNKAKYNFINMKEIMKVCKAMPSYGFDANYILCHRLNFRYLMYLYCLAVEAGCYSDIVEFAVRSVVPRVHKSV